MKEISDEWQLKLFDLLEGNLSEAESAELLNQISNSSDLYREYSLLQATYLNPADTEEYPFKNQLLKSTQKSLWIHFRFFHYAAAASILFIFGLLSFLYLNVEKTAHSPAKITNQSQCPAAKSSNPTHVYKNSKRFQPRASEQTGETSVKLTPADKIFSPAIKQDSVAEPKFVKQLFSGVQMRTIAINNPPEDGINLSTFRILVYYPSEVPVSGAKKRTLSYKLLNSARSMLATLNFPNITVKANPVKGKILPAFDIRVQLPQNENTILANYSE